MTEKIIFDEHLKPLEKFFKCAFESIECGSHNIGFPDVYFSTDLCNGVIELKQMPNLIVNEFSPDYRRGQLVKLTRLRKINRHTHLLIYVNEEFYLTNEIKKTYKLRELKKSCLFRGNKLNLDFILAL